ncbi:MAG: hypothetical protein V4805_19020 [Pseudomonadota bacterium]
MTCSTRYIPFFLFLAFGCAIADEGTSIPSATALSKQLFSNTEFERSYQAGVTDSRTTVMKKFDGLTGTEGCPATFDVAIEYRVALDAMIDGIVGRKTFFAAIERELASLNGVQRRAAMTVMQSPRFFEKPRVGFSAWIAWLDKFNSDALPDLAPGYTIDEKLAGPLAIKRGIAFVVREGNDKVRSHGPKLYAQYKQQLLIAIDRCIADEETRLQR